MSWQVHSPSHSSYGWEKIAYSKCYKCPTTYFEPADVTANIITFGHTCGIYLTLDVDELNEYCYGHEPRVVFVAETIGPGNAWMHETGITASGVILQFVVTDHPSSVKPHYIADAVARFQVRPVSLSMALELCRIQWIKHGGEKFWRDT